ncbi:probable amidase At4g34880 [Humulus lupulus]|uniref:probable amidase At4g34880 n=1 Tax=Humulus lupulus TaxID=3486 RepID=UPI002B415C88|nr:probable amidase At4g34880 [Humulus lupulus]
MGALSLSSICHLLVLILLSIFSTGYHSLKPADSINNGFSIEEATVDDIQLAFRHNKLTSRQLVQFYIDRIQRLNPVLHGVIEVNPDAGALADKADHERKVKAPISFSKLHGIPVLVKDNIATKDKMNTTAGSLALLGSVVPRDAGVVAKLKKAGAIILGKASLTEWSAFRGNAPDGWSARGGQGVNPYYKMGFRSPCGSSSGSSISAAANLATVTLGTETAGSIICPSSLNSVVGIKPTIGLTSRAGVVPISHRQDTVGPICRTVSDATYVLDVIAGVDKNDKTTIEKSKYIPKGGYAQFLRSNGLKGKRLGIVRHPYFEFNISKEIDTFLHNTFEQHLNTLRKNGAIVIDNLNITNIDEIMNDVSSENTALIAEFKIDLNAYLKELVSSPVRSIADVIAFNKKNSKLEKIKEYGQELLIAAEATNGIRKAEKAALATLARQTRNGFVKLMREYKLDALVASGGSAFPYENVDKILAIGGFPGITVPAGYGKREPFGIFLGGLRGSEPKLIEIAYGFEQATKIRKPPKLLELDQATTTSFGKKNELFYYLYLIFAKQVLFLSYQF